MPKKQKGKESNRNLVAAVTNTRFKKQVFKDRREERGGSKNENQEFIQDYESDEEEMHSEEDKKYIEDGVAKGYWSIDEQGRRVMTPKQILKRMNDKYGFCELHGKDCQRIPRECWPKEFQDMISEIPLPLSQNEMKQALDIVNRINKKENK